MKGPKKVQFGAVLVPDGKGMAQNGFADARVVDRVKNLRDGQRSQNGNHRQHPLISRIAKLLADPAFVGDVPPWPH